eukprot:624908-Prymnesium_polylepis.2
MRPPRHRPPVLARLRLPGRVVLKHAVVVKPGLGERSRGVRVIDEVGILEAVEALGLRPAAVAEVDRCRLRVHVCRAAAAAHLV